MGWGSALSAGLQLGNTLLDSYFSREAFKDAKEWEREKLQNAHQWTVEDLRKAGLNPILSAGATNGTGGTITPHSVQSRMDGTAIMMAKEQMALMREQAKKEQALTRQADATAHNQWVQSDLASANVDIQQALLPQVQSASQLQTLQNKFDIDNSWTWQVPKFANSAGSVGSAISEFIPVGRLIDNFFNPKKSPKLRGSHETRVYKKGGYETVRENYYE